MTTRNTSRVMFGNSMNGDEQRLLINQFVQAFSEECRKSDINRCGLSRLLPTEDQSYATLLGTLVILARSSIEANKLIQASPNDLNANDKRKQANLNARLKEMVQIRDMLLQGKFQVLSTKTVALYAGISKWEYPNEEFQMNRIASTSIGSTSFFKSPDHYIVVRCTLNDVLPIMFIPVDISSEAYRLYETFYYEHEMIFLPSAKFMETQRLCAETIVTRVTKGYLDDKRKHMRDGIFYSRLQKLLDDFRKGILDRDMLEKNVLRLEKSYSHPLDPTLPHIHKKLFGTNEELVYTVPESPFADEIQTIVLNASNNCAKSSKTIHYLKVV